MLLELGMTEVANGDNWSCKTCKAPVKSPPTNQHPVFYRPDALPVAQTTVSEHWRKQRNKSKMLKSNSIVSPKPQVMHVNQKKTIREGVYIPMSHLTSFIWVSMESRASRMDWASSTSCRSVLAAGDHSRSAAGVPVGKLRSMSV